MLINELIESNDPLMDLVRAKEAGFSPDSVEALVDKYVAVMAPKPAPVATVKPTTATVAKAKPITAPAVAKAPAQAAMRVAQAPGSIAWTQVRDYLISKGLSTAHAIGMLANIEHESGFKANTLVTDSNGLPSGGLFQHNGPRLATLQQKLGSGWANNWQGQIDFALNEPDGQRYLGNKFSDPHAASKWWTMHFERPAKAKVQAARRAKTATKFASR